MSLGILVKSRLSPCTQRIHKARSNHSLISTQITVWIDYRPKACIHLAGNFIIRGSIRGEFTVRHCSTVVGSCFRPFCEKLQILCYRSREIISHRTDLICIPPAEYIAIF